MMQTYVKRFGLAFAFVISASLLAGCDELPRDPNATLKHVTGGHLRVGLIEQAPWVVRTPDGPAGVEVTLVRALARELRATPEWHWGGEQRHMEALGKFELDLVVGGLTAQTPWTRSVGVSKPYFEDPVLVGAAPSQSNLVDLRGREVAAERGTIWAADLRSKHAVPVPLDGVTKPLLVAAPLWQLQQWGLRPTQFELRTERHVVAVPPGENGWLFHVERFLNAHRAEITRLLQAQGGAS